MNALAGLLDKFLLCHASAVAGCRLVRTDIQTPTDPSTWKDVIPEHASNLLQWSAALKASPACCQSRQATICMTLMSTQPCGVHMQRLWQSDWTPKGSPCVPSTNHHPGHSLLQTSSCNACCSCQMASSSNGRHIAYMVATVEQWLCAWCHEMHTRATWWRCSPSLLLRSFAAHD